MRELATMPSPFGKAVPFYVRNALAGDFSPADFVFDMDGTLDMAGVYDPRQRRRCAKALRNGAPMDADLFKKFGGGLVPTLKLLRPNNPVYPQLRDRGGTQEALEQWASFALEAEDWAVRADVLLNAISESRENLKAGGGSDSVTAFGASLMLTSALEHLCEPDVRCLEQAAFYTFSRHAEWRAIGLSWLQPFFCTWFRDWAAARPVYRDFGNALLELYPDLSAGT